MLSRLHDHYRITTEQATHYRGQKFDQSIVFEHEDGRFKVIEWGDRDNPDKMECKEIIEHHDCQYVLKCQYNPIWHVPKLRPFFYFEKTSPKVFSAKLDRLRDVPKTKHLFWRGHLKLGRETLLARFEDLLNNDYREMVPLERYHEEIAEHKMAVSLPGLGKSCHREFECFGIGTVVVSPPFQNIYHVPLVPDYHYLTVDFTDHEGVRRKLAKFANRLDQIRANAIKYYDSYIRFEASADWLKHLLEL
jgi:hypothetical protein